jgi:hypothetical protein
VPVKARSSRPESLLGIVSEAILTFDQQLHGMEDRSLQVAEQPVVAGALEQVIHPDVTYVRLPAW